MRLVRMGEGEAHAAPVEGGPVAELLVGGEEGGRLGVARVVVPPGGGMPEHEHGESEALVLPQEGRVVIRGEDGREQTLDPGTMALIGVGERVSLTNPSGSEEAVLLAFFAPSAFVRTLASWPAADG